jgi:hypothetical protein
VLNTPKSTVGAIVLMARAAGVDWAVAQTLGDEELEARLYRPAVPRRPPKLPHLWPPKLLHPGRGDLMH